MDFSVRELDRFCCASDEIEVGIRALSVEELGLVSKKGNIFTEREWGDSLKSIDGGEGDCFSSGWDLVRSLRVGVPLGVKAYIFKGRGGDFED